MDVGRVSGETRKMAPEANSILTDTIDAFVRHISPDLRDIMLKELRRVRVSTVAEIAAKSYVSYMKALGAPSADLINSILAHHYGHNLR